MREKRIFIGLSDRFAKPLSSEGFARVDFSGDNHRGGSRSPDHCGDYCSTQKSVHNLGNNETCLESAESLPLTRLVGVFAFLIEPWTSANWVIQNEKKRSAKKVSDFESLSLK